MKKTTRSLLITALILFCTGLLLSLSASLYAIITHQKIFDVEKKDKNIESITVGIDDILSHSPNSNFVKKLSDSHFTQIDVTSFAGNVKICTGAEKTELILKKANTSNLNYEIVGGTLKIEEVDPVGFCGIYIGKDGLTFKGLRHIFSPGNAINSRKTIILNLAKDTPLAELNISSYMGNVICEKISAEKIDIHSTIGDIRLKDLANESAKITISGSLTDIDLENNAYSSCSVNTKFGDIDVDLKDQVGQSTILDLWCGDVDMETALPTTYYKLSISTTLGSIERNDKHCGKKLSDSGSTASRISSGILMGDFSLSFKGKDESKFIPPVKEELPAGSEAGNTPTTPEDAIVEEPELVPVI